jgi:protein-S-isoprenylcysteine O-methyltransferase Ste14
MYLQPTQKSDTAPARKCLSWPRRRRHSRRSQTETANNMSTINTYAKCAANPCRMRTYKITGLKTPVMNTYKKVGGGEVLLLPKRPPASAARYGGCGTIAPMSALELRIPPPLVALFMAILMWLTPALAGSLAIPSGLRLGVALALLCLGLGIAVSGVVGFRLARTTLNPIKASTASALVSGGIFRFTRNPMYLGLLLQLLAWAVFLSNPLALLFLPVYVLYIDRFQIIPEERALATLFGSEYSAYTGSVRRWL